jgi:transcriptional regulator GlxA family with amidase domain
MTKITLLVWPEKCRGFTSLESANAVHKVRATMADARTQTAVNLLESRTTDARVSLILDLLNDAGCQWLDLDQLSARCNLSRSRVQHLFKEHTGTTPTRHLKQVKLLKAKDLLEHSFYTVKQIAWIVGFSDISHFVRDYKLLFGRTPTESRRHAQWCAAAKLANT